MGKFTKTKDWLIQEYVINNRSRKELSKECGLSVAGLKSLLAKWNIVKETLDIPKSILQELVDKKLSHSDIEKQLGISQTTLYRYLKKYNLELKAEVDRSQYDDSNDELMCQLYLDGFSTTEIGEELGLSHNTVIRHLQHCGVPRRTLTESQWTSHNKSIPEEFNSYDKMYELYITKKLSKKDLGIKFGCDPCVIDRVLKELKIPVRTISEAKQGLMCSEKHWNWKGGVTTLARRLREYFGVRQVVKVLERDHYQCQMCGSKHNLNVHHKVQFSDILSRILNEHPNLDPIKDINELYSIATNDKEFNDLDNLITYCRDCHFYKVHQYGNLQADLKPSELLES